MTQELEFDCVICERRIECNMRDNPTYCPKAEEQGRGTRKNRAIPIQFWGQRNK